jgi:hypothetical protein
MGIIDPLDLSQSSRHSFSTHKNMNHLTDPQLNEYLDGTLDAVTKRHCDEHLASCGSCRARLDELQDLFAELSSLAEARLPHDLTAKVLAGLPSKQPRTWTPAFAAQLGAALGASLWLSVQITKFVLPLVAALRPPQLRLPNVALSLPTFDLQWLALNLLRLAISIFQPAIPELRFAPPELPRLQIPSFDLISGGLSNLQLLSIAACISLLWIIGNFALLRVGKEVKS